MKKILLSVTFGLVTLCLLTAQEAKSYQIIQKSEKGVPVFIRFEANTDVTHESFFEKMKDEFGFKADDKFELQKTTKDKLGVHYKYSQQYKGIVVYGVQYIIHEKNAIATSANGKFIPNLSIDVKPTITKDVAIKKAQEALNLEKYKWQDENLEKALKAKTKNANASYYPKPELVIEPMNGNYKTGEFRLSWKFLTEGVKMTNAWIVFIDAHSGELINKIAQVANADVTGTLNTYYYGPRSMQVEQIGSSYLLAESGTRGPSNSQRIDNLNYNNTTVSGTPIIDNTLSFSADPIAVGAHWAMEKSYDFFYSRYLRNSYDYNGSPIYIGSHYLAGATGALYNSIDSSFYFGDGDGVITNAWSALDIVGHELYHAYTNYSSDLIPQGESGALNESFSDIMGAGVEYSVFGIQSGLPLFGEDVFITPGGYSRSLADPKSKNHPNTYNGQYWAATSSGSADQGGIHINCGVQNYWFYLLAQGGSGTNDNGNSYNVTGIGIDSALDVAYWGNTTYLTMNSDFNDAMFGTLAAAVELYGISSPKVQSVKNAWCAVGLDCNSVGIKEAKNPLDISIYPNPASNSVTIISDGKPMLVSLYDITGREIISTQMDGSRNILDISKASQGMYVVRVQEGEKSYQQKLIVQ